MYFIIGGNGFLGSYLIQSILKNTEDTILATARNITMLEDTERICWKTCDIREQVSFDHMIDTIKEREDVKVIFLAAYHHPDLVAENPYFAWDINVTTLSKCINKLRFAKKLFYASTDSVYGNSRDKYHFKETDALNPVNVYGKNKAAAEAVVKYAGFHVVRYPFLIAPSLVKNKKHFYDKILEQLKNGNMVEMFYDSFRSSLNFSTAADLMIELCEFSGDVPSVLNVCGDKDLSKYDIGLLLADKAGVSRDLVKPISISEGSGIFKSKRAVSTLMDNTLLKQILNKRSIDFVL